MRILLLIMVALLGQVVNAQNFVWAKSFSGIGWQNGTCIAVDASGNVYTAGRFTGTTDFDPGPGTYNLTSLGSDDFFITKLNSSGDLIWAISIGGVGYDIVRSITLDASGNIFATGTFSQAVDFNPGIDTFELTTPQTAMFILKLDSSANFIWAKSWASSSGTSNSLSIALDSKGNIYTTGNYNGTVDFDPGPGIVNLVSSAFNWEAFILKLDSSGGFVWAKSMRVVLRSSGLSIAIDTTGSVYTTGYYTGTIDLDPGLGTYNLNSAGNDDVFISKLDSAGDFIWGKSIGGSNNEIGISIAIDSKGNVCISGTYSATVDFNPGLGVANLTSVGGSNDVFILKLNSTGNFMWAKSLGGNGSDYVYHMALDAKDNIYTTGQYWDSADFDPGSGIFNLNNSGTHGIYISKLSFTGNFVWASSIGGGGTTHNIGYSIALDAYDNVYTTGKFRFSTDFDPGPDTFRMTPVDLSGTYIHKMNQCEPKYGVDVLNVCNPITWIDGILYTSSNSSANYNLTTAGGCDSVVFLSLTFGDIDSVTDVVSACDSFTWVDGNTYTASNNTATLNLTNLYGCDSIVTLNLTIVYSNAGTDVVIACDSFRWIDGNTYTVSNNTATYTLTNADGCDSVVTLDLTIIYSNTGTDVVSACDAYTWIDGNTYTSSNNSATYNLTNASGCDSLVTLDLTIVYSNTGTDVVSACDVYTWIDGITYTASNNSATHTLANASGCDSVVTLNLTLSYSNTGTDVVSTCDAYTWIDGNTYTSSNNTATHTLANASGCDSVVTLNLTINSVSDNSTTTNGNTITANNNSASYRWLDCANNYQFIAGEVSQSFTAAVNGHYAVELTENGCIDTSDCVQINSVGFTGQSFSNQLKVYPNPSSGFLVVAFEQEQQYINLIIRNILGHVVYENNYASTNQIELVLDAMPGIYILELIAKDQKAFVRVVKE